LQVSVRTAAVPDPAVHPGQEISMSRALYCLAGMSYRHRRLVLTAWLVVILAVISLGLLSGGTTVDNFSVPGTQSQQALTQLEQATPALVAPSTQVVFASTGAAKVTGSAQKAAIETSITRLRSGPQVASVSDPFTSGLVSKNGQVALATVSFTVAAASDVTAAALSGLTSATAPASTAGLQVDYGGEVYPGGTSSTSELPELIGVLVALVVLLVMFGTLIAAGIPLVAALTGVVVVTTGTTALAAVAQISSAAVTVALMLALACGIDYALFIVHRHRTQLQGGIAPGESVSRAVGTAGSSVVFAALTVVVALCGLALTGIPFLEVMGFTGAGAVLLALLISLTLLPAMLGFAGEKVLASRRTHRARRRSRPGAAVPAGQRWAVFVVRRRTPLAIAVIAVLAVLAVPASRLSLGLPISADPPTSSSQAAASLIADNLGAGFNGPLLVVAGVSAQNASSTVAQIDSALTGQPGVLTTSTLSAKAPLAVVEVVPSSGPNAAATATLVAAIRGLAPGIQQRTGASVLVGGSAASAIDTSDQISADLPVLLAVIIGLALVLLTFALRAPLVPLESVLGYLLSVFAALGAEVAVFQWGWARQLLGVTPGVTLSFLPVIVFTIIFGLSNDYQIFVVSRIKEEHDRSHDARGSIRSGLADSSRVVTAAALIMALVFVAFTDTSDPTVQAIAFTLAAGVFLDAFLVRLVLVPALLAIGGNLMWHRPRWLERYVPDPDIEGARLPAITSRPYGQGAAPGDDAAAEPDQAGQPARCSVRRDRRESAAARSR
jgi:putative drug exporter of the RND superfamily